MDLNLLRSFALVHSCGSFSKAAQQLGVPRSTVSRAIAALETQTGQLLFHRSTRQVTTTPAGLALFDRVQPWLERLEAAVRDLPEAAPVPSGMLRLTASVDLGPLLLADVVARYLERYPDTQVDVQLTAQVIDLSKSGLDLALRYGRGGSGSGSQVARKIGAVSQQYYAAPAYLARHGTPQNPTALANHHLVVLGADNRGLPTAPRVHTNDKLFAQALLRAGGGIGLLPLHMVADDVQDGKLVRVLPQVEHFTKPVYLVLPSRRFVPAKVTAFRDLLLETLRLRPLA